MRRSPPTSQNCLLATLGFLLLSCACNRTEEPAAPSSAEGPAASPPEARPSAATLSEIAASATAPSAAPSAPRPACTVPFGPAAAVAPKAAKCPKDPAQNLSLELGKITFSDAPGAPQVEVEFARDDASRERGLMYRTSMPTDHGMLFSWHDERVRNFWMHNTCIPLDMLYVTKEGIIAGILEQVPTLSDAPRGIDCPVAHVLELNAGWARSHGLAPGMKLKIEG